MKNESGKNKKKQESGAAAWEVIYCSLVLILVAFFAMLVSYSSVQTDKVKNFRKEAGFISKSLTPGSDTLNLSPDILQAPGEVVTQIMKSLRTYLTQAGLDNSVNIEKNRQGFKVTFGSSVLFSSGKAEINKDACSYLDAMIKITRNNPFSIRVEGHTDSVPINTPEFPSNWELSTTRAVNILRYILEKGDIPADKLAAVGFSQYHPIASNNISEGRQKNRRVDFYFEL
ncbi:MAG: OmpA family protein [Desulfobacterales bacterium]|nr:OmpA family protein [Desulfobacterales bacterium]